MSKKQEQIKYYPDAVIECACGNRVRVGSTQEAVKVEICAACHPFFTGKSKLLDKAGRVERFQARVKKAHELQTKKSKTAASEDK